MAQIEAGEYRTATGKVIKIEKPTRVPTAAKRHTGVRIATGVIFMGFIFAIGITAIVLVWVLYKPPSDEQLAQQRQEEIAKENFNAPTFIYSSSANPAEIEQANVLGLPLTPRTAVIVEVSDKSSKWVEPVSTVLSAGLGRPESARDVAIIAAFDNGASLLKSGMTPSSTITSDQVKDLVVGDSASGSAKIADAIDLALDQNPTQIILVVSGPSSSSLSQWSAALEDHPDLPVSVILVADYSSALRQWQRDLSAGRYVDLSQQKLDNWYESASSN